MRFRFVATLLLVILTGACMSSASSENGNVAVVHLGLGMELDDLLRQSTLPTGKARMVPVSARYEALELALAYRLVISDGDARWDAGVVGGDSSMTNVGFTNRHSTFVSAPLSKDGVTLDEALAIGESARDSFASRGYSRLVGAQPFYVMRSDMESSPSPQDVVAAKAAFLDRRRRISEMSIFSLANSSDDVVSLTITNSRRVRDYDRREPAGMGVLKSEEEYELLLVMANERAMLDGR